MSAKPLLVLGSINADLYVEIERLPQPGETLLGGGAAMRPGGKGANQAAAAARLGAATAFAGQLGSDAYAAPLRAALAGAGVDTALVAERPGPTGQAFILLQQGGENSIILVGGANQAWDDLGRPIEERIRASGALLLQREIPEAINLAAARVASAAGVPVILDAGGAQTALARELVATLAVVSPNESELARLTGRPVATQDEVLAAARALQDAGAGAVLVKLGKRGALLVPPGGDPLAQEAFAVPVIDTTGAGDCFTAAYVVGMLDGIDEARRLRFAAAAAALCIQKLGAMPSMPARAEVEEFLRSRSRSRGSGS